MRDGYATIFFAILCTIFISQSYAQPFLPPSDPVYIDTTVARIDITVDEDSLALIYEDVWSNHEYPATFSFDNGVINEVIDTVGFRLRGNTSRVSDKKSFKVSFNSFESGANWYGYEKLNLNGEHNDPSIIRAKIAWDLIRDTRVPGSHSNHVALYINDDFYGLYISVEHIDENFIEKRFEEAGGNLYKCLWPADLGYLGDDPEDYKAWSGDRRIYDLKTNTAADDYSDLRDFIVALNTLPDATFVTEIQKLFNVNSYLKALAIEMLVAHWDNYSFNQNNYYLYNDPATGKFEYIHYDLDNTFGIWWDGILPGTDWATRDLYEWGHPTAWRPLVSRVLDFDIFRNRLSFYIHQLVEAQFQSSILEPQIAAMHTMITPFAEADIFRTLDYGWTIDDFHDSYTQSIGGHVTYGIYPYIGIRSASASNQLEMVDIAPIISFTSHTPQLPGTSNPINVTCLIEDESIPLAEVIYRFDGGAWQTGIPLVDDGLHDDREANDNIYGAQLPALGEHALLEYYVQAEDAHGQQSADPFNGPGGAIQVLIGTADVDLVINEFMADNETTIADPEGEFEDWIELFNSGSDTLWLADYYLTDDFANPLKWQLPEMVLEPGDFLLIWADEDGSQGPTHANFKLSRLGEEVGIFAGENMFVVDSLSFGAQPEDTSYGRYPDGADQFEFFSEPTPGLSNVGTGIFVPSENIPFTAYLAQNYPNPFNGQTSIPFALAKTADIKISLFDVLGREVMILADGKYTAGNHHVDWDGKVNGGVDAASGIYIVVLEVSGAARKQRDQIKLLLAR